MILLQIWKMDLQQFSEEESIMSNIYKGALELIGNTPIVEVVNLEAEERLEATVLVSWSISIRQVA